MAGCSSLAADLCGSSSSSSRSTDPLISPVISQLCSLRRFHARSSSQAAQPRHASAAAAAAPGQRAVAARASSGGGGGGGSNATPADDGEFAVFRFTLGIPGFEDRFVPRVVGCLGLLLLGVNHLLGADPAPEAQVRAEWLGAALAAVAFVAPDVESRLAEAQPGRGRTAAAGALKGGANAFALAEGLPDEQRKELAWASFALLKNTNSCSVLVWRGGRALMARGQLAAALAVDKGGAGAILEALTQAAKKVEASPKLAPALKTGGGGAYVQDIGALAAAGASSWGFVPEGVESLMVQRLDPLPGSGSSGGAGVASDGSFLVVLCDRPRALSSRERQWVAAVAAKLAGTLEN